MRLPTQFGGDVMINVERLGSMLSLIGIAG
jgi:hypothetical protein